jgi:hypothetical protein
MSDDLFDYQEATTLRDTALAQVEANANTDWCNLTVALIESIARQQPELTSDDVWKALADFPNYKTHQPSAMGAMFKRASSKKLIAATDRFVQSTRPSSHARPIRVWSSQIIKE